MAVIDVRHPEPPRAASEIARVALRAIFSVFGGAIAIALAIAVGVYSSRSMIAAGSFVSTEQIGPWVHWTHAGSADADPYTRAHIARSGALTLASDSAGVFEASVDATGARLHSSCDYVIEGPDPGGLWWSMSVFDKAGRLIANDAGRHTFTRETAAKNPNGSFIITLGRDARPGNWLPTGGAGRLAVVYTILDPATGLSDEERTERNTLLPVIRREGCS